jgi:hypothetical protein
MSSAENKVLMTMFGYKLDEVRWQFWILHEEVCDLYWSRTVLMAAKLRGYDGIEK